MAARVRHAEKVRQVIASKCKAAQERDDSIDSDRAMSASFERHPLGTGSPAEDRPILVMKQSGPHDAPFTEELDDFGGTIITAGKGKSKSSIRESIQSHKGPIAKHKDAIEEMRKTNPFAPVIEHWQKEIRTFEANIEKELKKLMRKL